MGDQPKRLRVSGEYGGARTPAPPAPPAPRAVTAFTAKLNEIVSSASSHASSRASASDSFDVTRAHEPTRSSMRPKGPPWVFIEANFASRVTVTWCPSDHDDDIPATHALVTVFAEGVEVLTCAREEIGCTGMILWNHPKILSAGRKISVRVKLIYKPPIRGSTRCFIGDASEMSNELTMPAREIPGPSGPSGRYHNALTMLKTRQPHGPDLHQDTLRALFVSTLGLVRIPRLCKEVDEPRKKLLKGVANTPYVMQSVLRFALGHSTFSTDEKKALVERMVEGGAAGAELLRIDLGLRGLDPNTTANSSEFPGVGLLGLGGKFGRTLPIVVIAATVGDVEATELLIVHGATYEPEKMKRLCICNDSKALSVLKGLEFGHRDFETALKFGASAKTFDAVMGDQEMIATLQKPLLQCDVEQKALKWQHMLSITLDIEAVCEFSEHNAIFIALPRDPTLQQRVNKVVKFLLSQPETRQVTRDGRKISLPGLDAPEEHASIISLLHPNAIDIHGCYSLQQLGPMAAAVLYLKKTGVAPSGRDVTDILKQLSSYGADPNQLGGGAKGLAWAPVQKGEAALHIALEAWNGSNGVKFAQVLTVLVKELGADPDCRTFNEQGETPLHLVQRAHNWRRDLLPIAVAKTELLIKLGADLNALCDGRTPLHAATRRCAKLQDTTVLMKTLIDAGADINLGNETPLHAAAEADFHLGIEYLLLAGADIDSMTVLQPQTPLFMAAKNLHADAVQLLITAGADKLLLGENGLTPLQVATLHGNQRCIAILT